jgi:hypothetical protein
MGALIISALLVFMAAPLCFICARSYIKLGSSSGDDPSGMVGLIAEAQVNFCEQGSVLVLIVSAKDGIGD